MPSFPSTRLGGTPILTGGNIVRVTSLFHYKISIKMVAGAPYPRT